MSYAQHSCQPRLSVSKKIFSIKCFLANQEIGQNSPHNGRNLTLHHFGDAVVEALNTVPEYGTKPAGMFIKGWGKDYFDLEDLNTPGILQHIGSLSRDDVTEDEAHINVVPGRVAALLSDSPGDHINAESIAKSRLRVEAISKPKNLSKQDHLLAYVESSLVLMMMKEETVPSAFTLPSSKTWTAPKDRVQVWLTEERLPNELGWKRSERQLKPADLFPIMKAIFDQKRVQSGAPALWKIWYWIPLLFGGDAKDEL